MTRSKKTFLGFVIIFVASLVFLVYDISRKTTFPGAKSHTKRAQDKKFPGKRDTLKSTLPPKSPIHQP